MVLRCEPEVWCEAGECPCPAPGSEGVEYSGSKCDIAFNIVGHYRALYAVRDTYQINTFEYNDYHRKERLTTIKKTYKHKCDQESEARTD